MYVILTKDIPGVGQKNGLLNVSKGYFMNFLQPQNMAKIATSSRLEALKGIIAAQKTAAAQSALEMQVNANALAGVTLVLSGKASAKGTLFKALSEKDIMAALKKQSGVEVGKSDIDMEHLKKVGDHTVKVKLGGKSVTVKVKLEAKEA